MNLTRHSIRRGYTVRLRSKALNAVIVSALILFALHFVEPARARPAGPGQEGSSGQEKKEATAEVETHALTPGEVVSRELEGGKDHVYLITATKGQYIRGVVAPADETVESSFQTPDGKRIGEIRGTSFTRRLAIFSHVAESSGVHRLQVHVSRGKRARYEIRLEALRDATPQDKQRVEAEGLFKQAKAILYQPAAGNLSAAGATARGGGTAADYFKKALGLWRGLGEPAWQATTLGGIASAYYLRREYPEAIDATRQALSIWRSLGNRHGEARALRYLASLHHLLSQKDEAARSLEQALKLWRSLYDGPELKGVLYGAAEFYNSSGDKQKALDLYEEVLRTERRLKDRSGQAATLYLIGRVYESANDKGRALKYISESYVTSQEVGDRTQLTRALYKIKSLTERSETGATAAAAGTKTEAAREMADTASSAKRESASPRAAPQSSRVDRRYSDFESNKFSYTVDPPDEAELWESVRELSGPSGVQAYLNLFPNGRFADEAKARLSSVAQVSDADADPSVIHRFPTIESQDPVEVGRPFALQVWLMKEPVKRAPGGAGAKPAPPTSVQVQADALKKPWKVEVILTALDFELVGGSNFVTIDLPADGDSEPAVFHLKPKSINGARHTSTVFATIRYEENFLARISQDITIVSAPQSKNTFGPVATGGGVPKKQESSTLAPDTLRTSAPEQKKQAHDAAAAKSETSDAGGGKPAPPAEKEVEEVKSFPRISIEKNVPSADLTMVLIEGLDPRHPEQTYIQVTSRFFKGEATFRKPPDQQGWIDDGYEQFSQMSARAKLAGRPSTGKPAPSRLPPSPELAVSHLRGFGRELYQKFAPELFKEAFWKLRGKLGDGFRSIQIFTNNPNFPWELMRPFRPGGSDERDFIGIEYAVGRWHQHNTNDLQNLPLKSAQVQELAVIAPQYTGVLELVHQGEELKALAAIPGYRRVPGQISHFKHLFGEFPQGIIHFAGHGVVVAGKPGENQQFAILLEDGEVSVVAWHGMVSRQTGHNPFIFFNACDLGRTRRVANSVDGWAPAALEAGASGYIGALWPLNDQGAARFGAAFYSTLMEQLQEGPVFVADVLRLTRKKFMQNNDPTFLGYVFYGDPNLKLVSAPRKD